MFENCLGKIVSVFKEEIVKFEKIKLEEEKIKEMKANIVLSNLTKRVDDMEKKLGKLHSHRQR